MSQHKKQDGYRTLQAKPQVMNIITMEATSEEIQHMLKQLLKAIYRDGATGTPRNFQKDVQTITDLLSNKD